MTDMNRFCADIGGSFIDFALVSATGALSGQQRRITPARDWGAFVASLRDLLGQAPTIASDAPLCIAVAGNLDPETGRLLTANIPCLNGRILARELGAALGCDVHVGNDADCFALAEARSDAGRLHRVVFAAILGTGVGGGLVVDGRLVQGAGGIAGEWGHGACIIAEEPRTPLLSCGCGLAGCLDTVGGARGLERLHRFLHGMVCDSRAIVAGWLAGEPEARETAMRYVELVSGPLAWVVNITGASMVPVGGGLGSVPELVAALDSAVRPRILRHTDSPLLVMVEDRLASSLRGAHLLGGDGTGPIRRTP